MKNRIFRKTHEKTPVFHGKIAYFFRNNRQCEKKAAQTPEFQEFFVKKAWETGSFVWQKERRHFDKSLFYDIIS